MLRLLFTEQNDLDVQAKGKKKFAVCYGSIHIVDVVAESSLEAKEKFIFTLVKGLNGKTIDFDIKDIK